ncbi:MAG: hypothetical protein AAGC93_30360 [Cyanobacteria bacterium P01_F01_bin.53]
MAVFATEVQQPASNVVDLQNFADEQLRAARQQCDDCMEAIRHSPLWYDEDILLTFLPWLKGWVERAKKLEQETLATPCSLLAFEKDLSDAA